jgi:diguanylate cyclase (GGDEF)-like protein/PAS domain S-box-containing protein
VQDVLLFIVFWCGVVYLLTHLLARGNLRELREARKSEQRFRDLTELSADWFWETDPEHRITWISGGTPVATLFGGTPTYGKRFWEIPGVQVEPRALESLREGLGEQLPFFDLEITRADERGARQTHIISGQCREDANGVFLGYRGVGRDVTEQRRAERALAHAKERLELALGGVNLAEWDYDPESDGIYLGTGWAAFLGGAAAAVSRGAELLELVHPDDRPAMIKSLVAALKGESASWVSDYRLRTESGGWRWLHCTGQVSDRDAAGRATRMSGTVTDSFRAQLELAADGIVVSCNSVIEYANAAAARIVRAASPGRLIGIPIEDFLHPDVTAGFHERSLRALDGSEITVEVASMSFAQRGRVLLQTMFRDVTESRKAREALAEREQRFRDVAEASGEYVWEADAAWRYSYLSERVESVLGYGRAELLGRRPQEFMPLGEERAVQEWLTTHAPDGRPFRDFVHRSITKAGGVIWQSVSAVPVRDASGRFIGYRGTAADVTPRKQAEARIEYLATRDALTGLPNRVLLTDRGGQAILNAARSRTQLAVLCIDVDRFKLVNESLGHQGGDALLRAIAERLQNLLPADTLARLGGDDFVLIQNIRNVEDAAGLGQRILAVLARPFTVDARTLNVGASIGISVYPNDGRDLAELLKNADAAMYHAKESGRGTFRFFSPSLHARSVERLRLENELRQALARSELILHWQPVVKGRRRVVGVEALVRWQHPERGLLLPDDFVPLAEECGLIRSIDEWTLERALSQAGAWQRSLPGRSWFAINVSAPELAHDSFIHRIQACLEANQLSPSCLELEVTERVLMSSLEQTTETLRRLGELGVRIAIDDFGTGYSSLAYLRQLPIHKLKVDRSFLRSIDSQAADEAIVRAITVLARTLGLSVAAEGVENEAQLSHLLALGCDEWQGHYFSPPIEAGAFERVLHSPASAANLG